MSGLVAFSATILGGWVLFNLIGAFIVGAAARAIFPGKNKLGWFKTIGLGYVGGILGKLVFWILRWPSGFPMGFIASVAGAFVLLLVFHIKENLPGREAKAS